MSEKDKPIPEAATPLVWDEQAIDSLMAQFRYMLIHEVKNMKLEVIENIGSMLARRSGIDREIHELTARVELLAKSVKGFDIRLTAHEKPLPAKPRNRRGLRGAIRDLTAESVPVTARPAPATPPPTSQREQKKRIGRPPGSGRYEGYNAAKRAKKAGGTP
jgi:hypothetical protein